MPATVENRAKSGVPLADALEDVGAGEVGQRLRQFEIAVRRRVAGVNHALRNALVVKMGDLLTQDEVIQQRRAAATAPQRVLVVGDRHALVGGQRRMGATRLLLDFPSRTHHHGWRRAARVGFPGFLRNGHLPGFLCWTFDAVSHPRRTTNKC